MIPEGWADDGTTWDHPDVVLSDGPQSVFLDPEDCERLEGVLPRSGPVGFINPSMKRRTHACQSADR